MNGNNKSSENKNNNEASGKGQADNREISEGHNREGDKSKQEQEINKDPSEKAETSQNAHPTSGAV